MATIIDTDKFYLDVLCKALHKQALYTTDRILVVCGGEKDRTCLKALGFNAVYVSNISQEAPTDVENLPYEDNAYDAVIVHSGLHHCASPHRGLLEMYRVASRTLIVIEPAWNLATCAGRVFGVGQTYEFAAVYDSALTSGGWRNTPVPNWVYRFTPEEIRQTISCFSPFGPHRFIFCHRTRIPWRALRMRRNKLPWLAIGMAYPLLRMLDSLLPIFSNNLAAIIVKPKLPDECFPWIATTGKDWHPLPSWFERKYH